MTLRELRRGQHFLLEGREYVVVDRQIVRDVETGVLLRMEYDSYVRKLS